jgi:gamma-D-glutamyl-L-lysine dipeptidyl-peptidase
MQTPNGVITKNVTGLFKEKTIDSEQVTQAIMGQPVHIEKEEDNWMWVETWDTYHGWVMSRNVDRTVFEPKLIATVTSLFTDLLRTTDANGEIHTKLVVTTTLEALECQGDMVRVRTPNGIEGWVPARDVKITQADEDVWPFVADRKAFVRTAKRFLGVPYLWGASSPFGIDCSGFMQMVHKLNGISLLRDADIQAHDKRAIPVEKADLQPGDMVFFASGKDKTRITHVGMACGDGTFIHAAGQGRGVVINNLTDEPYDANYWGARRMPNDPAQRGIV